MGLANHTVLIAKNGSEIYIDDSGAPIRGDQGELTGIVLIFRDIGEKRQLEQQREKLLSELSARYAEIEASCNAAIAMAPIDAVDFRYLRVNRTLCEMLGLPEDKIVAPGSARRRATSPALRQRSARWPPASPSSADCWKESSPPRPE